MRQLMANPSNRMQSEKVRSQYGMAFSRLPGVSGTEASPAGLSVYVESDDHARLLGSLLRDNVDGVPLRWMTRDADGVRPAAIVDSVPRSMTAAQVASRYQGALSQLPGVSGVDVKQRNGPQGTHDAVVVGVRQMPAMQWSHLVKDSIGGVPLRFEPQTCFPGR